jgi:hypothetical protein
VGGAGYTNTVTGTASVVVLDTASTAQTVAAAVGYSIDVGALTHGIDDFSFDSTQYLTYAGLVSANYYKTADVDNYGVLTAGLTLANVSNTVLVTNENAATIGSIYVSDIGASASDTTIINNYGSIPGANGVLAVEVNASGGAVTISNLDATSDIGNIAVTNSGAVAISNFAGSSIGFLTTATGANTAIELTGAGTTTSANTATVTNPGAIYGNIEISGFAGTVTVNNSGAIYSSYFDSASSYGDLTITASTTSAVSVTNSGTMDDTYATGGATLTYINTGTAGDLVASGFLGLVTVNNGAVATTDSGTMADITLTGLTTSTASAATISNYGTADDITVTNFGGTVGITNETDATNQSTINVITVTNNGAVTITNEGVSTTSGSTIAAISASGNDSVAITNQAYATISATTTTIYASGNGTFGVTNDGTIISTDVLAIYGTANDSTSIDNSGTITGSIITDVSVIDEGPSTDTTTATTATLSTTVVTTTTSSYGGGTVDLTNSGTINGWVDLEGTDDIALDNSGQITGNVGIHASYESLTTVVTTVFADVDLNGVSDDTVTGSTVDDYYRTTTVTTGTEWGGDVDVTNSGVIGTSTTSGEDLTVSAAGDITFDNSGTVDDVTLRTDQAHSLTSTSVATDTDTLNTTSHVETVAHVTTINSTWTPTGGSVTVTNDATGTILGNLSVYDAGASVTNSGVIHGDVLIDGSDSIYTYASSVSSTDGWYYPTDTTTTTASTNTAGTITTTTASVSGYDYDFENHSNVSTSTYVSAGTSASLINEADLAATTTSVEGLIVGAVTINGDLSATLSNAGEIVGAINLDSFNGTQTTTTDTEYSSATTITSTATTTSVHNTTSGADLTYNTHTLAETISSYSESSSSIVVATQSYVTGTSASAISITNLSTGKLDGAVVADTSGSIVLTNAGLISGAVDLDALTSVGTTTVSASDTYSSSSDIRDEHTLTYTVVIDDTTPSNSTAATATDTYNYSYGYTVDSASAFSTSSVSSSVGGSVTLTNTGLDLASTTTSFDAGINNAVYIEANTTATVSNSGTISGLVDVEAVSWTASSSIGGSETYSFDSTSTGTTVTNYVTSLKTQVTGYSEALDSTSTTGSSVTYTVTGGDIGFVNSSTGTLANSIDLDAGGDITASNAGSITGSSIHISAAERSYSTASSTTTEFHDTNVTSSDIAGTLTITTSSVGSGTRTITENSHESTSASSQTWVGGDVSFANTGVIGATTSDTDVYVYAIGTTSVSNSGTIYGDVELGAQTDDLYDYASSYVSTTNSTSIVTFDTDYTYATATGVTTSYDNTYSTTSTQSSSTNSTRSETDVGGDVTFVNAGTTSVITGTVTIETVGDASFTNGGTVGATTSAKNVVVTASGDETSELYSGSFTTTSITTDSYVSDDNVNSTHTYDYSWDSLTSVVENSASTAIGGSASVTNSGSLYGVVTVSGDTGASLNNSGTIAGNIYVYSSASNGNDSSSTTTTVSGSNAGYTITGTVDGTAGYQSASSSSSQVVDTNDRSWETVGGVASLTNAVAGTIGASTSIVNVYVEGEASADVINDGTIWGNVYVNAWEGTYDSGVTDTVISSTSSAHTNLTTTSYNTASVLTGVSTLTLTESGASTSTSYVSSLVYNATGGDASLTNTSLTSIHGAVTVVGVDSAEVDNTGLITGAVTVRAHGIDQSTDSSTSTLVSSSASASDAIVDTYTVSGTASTLSLRTETATSLYETESSSSAYHQYSSDTSGGDAILINGVDAIIGVSASFVTVGIYGDTSAAVTNDGTIYGILVVDAESGSYVSATTVSSATSLTNSSTSVTVTDEDASTVFDISVTSSGSYTYTASYSSSSLEVNTVTGGDASVLTGTDSSITGNVTVSGAGSASLDNYGSLLGDNIYVYSYASETSDAGSSYNNTTNSYVSTYDEATTATYITASQVSTLTSVGTYSYSASYSDGSGAYDAISTTWVGGDATLTNEVGGVIGADGDLSNIYVHGIGASAVINNGTIWGNVYLTGVHTNTVSTSDQDTVRSGSSSDHYTATSVDTFVYNTATTVDTDVTTKVDVTGSTTYQLDTLVVHRSSTDVSDPVSYSGAGDLFGSLSLQTVASASLTNTGWIGNKIVGGETISVISSGNAWVFDSSESILTRSTDTESKTTVTTDITTTTLSTSVTASTASTSTTADTGTTYDYYLRTYSSSESSTSIGGTASLINSGTIGGSIDHPAAITIYGDAGASLDNSGVLNANVTVIGLTEDANTLHTSVMSDLVVTSSVYDNVAHTSTQTTSEQSSSTVVSSAVYAGGTVSATNSKRITGDLFVEGYGTATVSNTSYIYGDVTVYSAGFNTHGERLTNSTVTTASSLSSTVVTNTTSTTSHVTTTNLADSDATTRVTSSFGGNATLTNTGTIGLYEVASGSGEITITGGDVVMIANGNATLANSSATAIIYGSVNVEAYGYTETSTVSSADVYTQVVTVAGGNTITDRLETASESWSEVYTHTGGTASVTNAGTIGKSYASSNVSGADVTDAAGVYIYGEAGASLTNSGVIGGGDTVLSTTSNVTGVYVLSANIWDYASSGSSSVTTDRLDSYINANDTLTTTTASSSTYASTATGGSASIVNSGTIGKDILTSSFNVLSESDAYIIAEGDTGATISNTGTIQGILIEAESETYNMVGASSSTSTTTYKAGELVSGSYSYSSSSTRTATGGAASITNSGTILGEESNTSSAGNQIIANGYAGATISNTGTINLYDSGVYAYSYNYNEAKTDVVTGSYDDYGLIEEVETTTDTKTYVGGAAVIDNSGTITADDVDAIGYTLGEVLNTGTISGDVSADSAFYNYYLYTQTDETGATTSSIVDTLTETYTFTGGSAVVDNSGAIGGSAGASGYTSASIINRAAGTIGGGVIVNAIGENSQANIDGAVTSSYSGGTASLVNYGAIEGNFIVSSYAGSTLTNAADAVIDGTGDAEVYTYLLTGTNTFTNAGTIHEDTITFVGNTTATNSGAIDSDLYFYNSEAGAATASFTFADGSELYGDIVNSASSLTVNFVGGGEYDYDILNATATTKTGSGTWILTGDEIDLGATTVSGGALQLGEEGATTASEVTGDITIGSGGSLEGEVNITGNLTNNGTLVAGWMVAADPSDEVTSLLDNSNTVLASEITVTGNFVQGSTGTLVANVNGAISDSTTSIFVADETNSTHVTVGGTATVGGTVKVYVDKGGLYVDGASTEILSSTGTLTSTATASQSQSSLFVGFDLVTATSGSTHTLSVVVDRTSYSSVAENDNEAAIGLALDAAVSTVADQITADDFATVADYEKAQDLAGFLTDLDWNVTSAAQAAEILDDLSPDGYATLAALDTGIGYQNAVRKHLSAPGGAPEFGVWGQGYGYAQSLGSNDGARGLNGTTTGILAGFDFGFDNVVVGIAGGYSRTTFNTPDRSFHGSETNYQLGAYGKMAFDQLYIDAAVWGNFGSGDVTRDTGLTDRVVNTSIDPSEFRANLDAGYRFTTEDNIGITPYLNLSYRNSQLGDISEDGAGGLSYDLTDVGSSFFTPRLGVTFDGSWATSSRVTLKPLVGIGVEYQPKTDSIKARFQGGGDTFSVNGAAKNSLAVTPEVGLDVLIGKSFSLQVGYQGAIGGNGSTHGGWIGLRGNW